ncbi:immunity protein Imm33 domain-containing protein [Metaplanococcus flavidus]|uniref:Imm33-like domain-containing protein n=1 Tax=Metaplanococcus flavidus TaxID=569883 RepID=A0ABW3LBB8_9BACL
MIKKVKQKFICRKYGADFLSTDNKARIGVAENVNQGLLPINGLRIPPDEGTSGWFIWAGEEWCEDENFFLSHHVQHLDEWSWSENINKYLGLAPGWRFLISGDYVDVWFDEKLINTTSRK